MSLGYWLGHWIRGPNAWTPDDISQNEITAIFAGGLGEPKRSMNALRALLLKEHNIASVVGATFSVLDLPPYPYKRTVDVGKELYNYTRKHLKEYSESRVVFVGHSLGGLISLYVAHRLEREGYGHRVQRIFLIGSPLYGVDPQFLLMNSNLARNITQSFLNHVNSELTLLTSLLLADISLKKIVTLYSESDLLVHRSQATVSGATNICVESGHLLMIASSEVARIIYENL